MPSLYGAPYVSVGTISGRYPTRFLLYQDEHQDIRLTDFVRTVILLICLTDPALQASLNLRPNTDAITDFDGRDLGADFHGFANYFVADTDGEGDVAPPATNGVHVRAADATGFDLDIDVIVFEWFGFELRVGSIGILLCGECGPYFFLLKIGPFGLVFDHEAFECVWVTHVDNLSCNVRISRLVKALKRKFSSFSRFQQLCLWRSEAKDFKLKQKRKGSPVAVMMT